MCGESESLSRNGSHNEAAGLSFSTAISSRAKATLLLLEGPIKLPPLLEQH